MVRFFHVTSVLNRSSILVYGLDWRLIGAAAGIAGSTEPEREGCFLCRSKREVEWFVRMNNTGGPVDVWVVDGIEEESLVESPEGLHFVPYVISPGQLRLVHRDIAPFDRSARRWRWPPTAAPD